MPIFIIGTTPIIKTAIIPNVPTAFFMTLAHPNTDSTVSPKIFLLQE